MSLTRSLTRGLTRRLTRGLTSNAGVGVYLGQVATKSRLMDRRDATANSANSVTGCYLRDAVNGDGRLVLAGWFWDRVSTKQEVSLGGITYTATVEYDGVRYPVTWGGNSSVTATGLVEEESDPIAGLIAPSGALLKLRVWMSCASGVPWIQITQDTTVGDLFEYGTDIADKTVAGTPVQTTVGRMSSPIAFVAPTRKATVLITGDSIAAHYNDDYTQGNKDLTFGRCFGASLAYINAGSYGDTAAAFIANHARRVALKRYCSHVLSEIGVNDLSGGRTAAQLIPDLETVFGYFSDKRLKQTTITPRTNSTDVWLTVANQNTTGLTSFIGGAASERALVNAWKRLRSDVIEYTDFFETARDSGIWTATGVGSGKSTLDGLHPWNGVNSWGGYALSGLMTAAMFVR